MTEDQIAMFHGQPGQAHRALERFSIGCAASRRAQRRADRTGTCAERAERRAVIGDRQRQIQERDYSRGPGAPGGP